MLLHLQHAIGTHAIVIYITYAVGYILQRDVLKLTQVAKNHFAFATALFWH
jgi:hypothetical protein